MLGTGTEERKGNQACQLGSKQEGMKLKGGQVVRLPHILWGCCFSFLGSEDKPGLKLCPFYTVKGLLSVSAP